MITKVTYGRDMKNDTMDVKLLEMGLCWVEICLFLYCGGDEPGPQTNCGYCGYCAAAHASEEAAQNEKN